MPSDRVNEYLKSVCAEVRWRQAHDAVREELAAHIEDQTEAYMRSGMEREKAERKAVESMGSPAETGLRLDASYRPKPQWGPVIMLTARSEERDELQGFSLGVDEYISKPFSPKILVARVEALLRRTNAVSADVMNIGGICIDKAAHRVTIDGKEIELSFKEFELLTYFAENQGIALSREKILNNVWNYDYFGDARTIDTHVKKLRSKMGEKGDYIKTIWGMGYKFEVSEE